MICDKFDECVESIPKGKNSEQCKRCREETCNTNIKCTENGRRYNLINDKKLSVVNFLIDGGVYQSETVTKCDRLYVIKEDKTTKSFVLIELKGKGITHALEQLEGTANRHKSIFSGKRLAFRVICTGAPKIGNDAKTIAIKKRLFKNYNVIPIIRENSWDEQYSELCKAWT